MATDIDIASNALLLIGDEPISSFTEAGAGATAAANLYAQTYIKLLSEHPWTFALKEQELSKLSQAPDPLTNYSTAYQIPSDLIRLWQIMPHSSYSMVGTLLYSNQNKLIARYVFKPEESVLPPHFIEALQYKLAADFSISVTEDRNKAEYYSRLAQLSLSKAKNVDSQGKPQVAIVDSPFTDVRNGGLRGIF